MIKNYFKTAWRNLVKHKIYSFINITGLTVGLAVGILILMWVQDELSFDGFHKNAKNIYRLQNQVGTGSSQQIWQMTVAPIGVMAHKELPEVEGVARVSFNEFFFTFKYNEKIFTEANAIFADPSLFSLLDFNFIRGNRYRPFIDDNSVVITVSAAKKYFGDEDPLGKVISADDKTNLTVTAVVKDLPENSTIINNMFMPLSLAAKKTYEGRKGSDNIDNDFRQFSYATLLLLKPGTSTKELEVKLRNIHLRNKPDDTDIAYLLQPLSKMHLYKADGSDAGIGTVRMFGIIALLILLIACINYVNLSTARSMLRAKEVSLRKIVGAAKGQLFLQFIIETTLLFLLATILALGLIFILMPAYNNITGKGLVLDLSNYNIWMIIASTVVGTLVLSSIYPALLLSSFEPLKAIKGKISVRLSDAAFRKILVVTQFAFSIILIVGTIVIGRQLNYIHSKELGYDKDYVFSFPMRDMNKHYNAVRSELLKQPGIEAVSSASSNIISIGGQTGNTDYDGKGPSETFMVHPMTIDKDFIPFFKMELVQGKNFSGEVSDSMHYILNETAVRQAGIKDPVGKRFRMGKTEGVIIGVLKDFHFSSLKQRIEPTVFNYMAGYTNRIYIKTNSRDAQAAITTAETQWKLYNAGFPFSYAFLDDTFNNLYKSEQRTGSLFNIFAVIAIIISSLGLFGLAAFTAQRRVREIGVRKVLGASVTGIISMLAKDFIKLVFIAIVIAVPVAWYLMNKWLQDFAYRTNISWTVFVITTVTALLIALATISFQAIRAAVSNPVKSLRTE